MRIAVVMPRNMRFGPAQPTSIDLCAYDFVRRSRYVDTTLVVAEAVEQPFADIAVALHPRKDSRARDAAIRAHAPDLIVVHQHAPTAARIAAAFPDVPVLVHRHNMVKPAKGLVDRLKRRWRWRRIAGAIFVSAWARDLFAADWPGATLPMHVIDNALRMEEWTPAPERTRTIAFTGRAISWKGAPQLAEALAEVLAEAPDWSAHLMLSDAQVHPENVAKVRALLSPFGARAIIATDQPFSAVKPLLERAAIAVVPTIGPEPFGRAALEAMAGGAALVCTTEGGMGEVAGDAAIRLAAAEPALIADALRGLIADDAARARLAAAGRARAVARFDLDAVTARLDGVYNDATRAWRCN